MAGYPIGEAWREVARDLQEELRRLDPHAAVTPRVDDRGLLRLDAVVIATHREAARAAARRQETRAQAMCETCGSSVPAVQAGPVVAVLCASCRGVSSPRRPPAGPTARTRP